MSMGTVSTMRKGIDPIARAFLEKINALRGPQIYEMSPQDARNVLLKLQSGAVAKMPADIEDLNVPGGPNGNVSVRIVRPQGSTETLPVTVYFHGGGWVLGDKNTHDRVIRQIANLANTAVAFVNYTPSPEAKYPVPIEEAYAATKYFSEKGGDHKIDPSRLSVTGDSVGGNMAIAVTMMAKDRGGPQIRQLVLFYPVTDANFETGSYREFAQGYWLSREAMKWFWDNYLPDKPARKQPLASPLQASVDQLKGLPPTLLITDENDVLRDEGEAYAHKLIEAGVPVLAMRTLGIIHDFVMLDAVADTAEAQGAVKLACDFLKTGR